MKRLIRGCRLIDGSGDAPLERAAVMIEGDRISAVGTQDAFQHPESDVEVWDAAGLTLLPGLIDAHVHILANPDWQARPDRQPLTEELWALRAARFTRQTLDAARSELPEGFPVTSTIVDGRTVEEAVSKLDWQDGDLIMVGSSRLSVPKRLFLGSTAAKMLRVLEVPMMVVPRDQLGAADLP